MGYSSHLQELDSVNKINVFDFLKPRTRNCKHFKLFGGAVFDLSNISDQTRVIAQSSLPKSVFYPR